MVNMISISAGIGIIFAVLIVLRLCRVIYFLYFHPFSKIPGPKLAAATGWYEFYYDILKWPGGQYSWEVDKMHEKYGPIVRVTPYEVHIKDPEWYDRLYCNPVDGVRDKFPPSAHMTGTPLGIFGTVSHEAHRRRRGAISSFFSKKAINNIEPWIHQRTSALCSNFRSQQRRKGKIELRVNFLAFTTVMIAEHALHGTKPQQQLQLLDLEENALDWQKTIAAVAFLTPVVKQATWLIPLALKLPVRFWMGIYPPLGRIVRLNRDMRRSASTAIAEEASLTLNEKSEEREIDIGASTKGHNIFRTILRSSLPASEKEPERLGQEGFVAIAAGGETCGRMLTCAIYYVLSNEEKVLPPLMAELRTAMPGKDSIPVLKELEQLPFLTGVIKETLRLSALLTSRLPLVAPVQTLTYGKYVIPPGHPISMSLRHILHNETIYRRPLEFLPERWLKSDPDIEVAERWYVPFSRGTRNCVGVNMAYAQLYIVLASVLRRFKLQLHDVVYERDVEASRDCFIGEAKIESKGVHVTVKDRDD